MRKRVVILSAQKLRKDYQDFSSYALQEKFRSNNTSIVFSGDLPVNKSTEIKVPKKVSLISSSKKLDSVTPTGKNLKSTKQSSSVSRLYAGEQYRSSKPLLTSQKTFDYPHQADFTKYLNSLQKAKILSPDLELNYDVSQYYEGNHQLSLGLCLQLDDELQKHTNSNLRSINPSYLLESIRKLTELLRDILRSLKSKSCNDEVEVLELLWRTNVKLVDTALVAHEAQTVYSVDRMRENTRITLEKIREENEKVLNKSLREKDRFMQMLEESESKLKAVKKEYRVLEEKFNQKEGMMQELAEIDKFDILKNTKKILDDLTETLTKVTDERKFQLKVVSKLT